MMKYLLGGQHKMIIVNQNYLNADYVTKCYMNIKHRAIFVRQ